MRQQCVTHTFSFLRQLEVKTFVHLQDLASTETFFRIHFAVQVKQIRLKISDQKIKMSHGGSAKKVSRNI